MKKVELKNIIEIVRLDENNKDVVRKSSQELSIETESDGTNWAILKHDKTEYSLSLENLKSIGKLIENAVKLFEDYPEEGRKFARKCLITGKGINEGWLINGDYYSTQELADVRAKEEGYSCFDEMYQDYSFDEDGEEIDNDNVYWTQWEDEDNYQYQVVNGVLTEIEFST